MTKVYIYIQDVKKLDKREIDDIKHILLIIFFSTTFSFNATR